MKHEVSLSSAEHRAFSHTSHALERLRRWRTGSDSQQQCYATNNHIIVVFIQPRRRRARALSLSVCLKMKMMMTERPNNDGGVEKCIQQNVCDFRLRRRVSFIVLCASLP